MKTHRLLMVGVWILAAFVPLGAAAKGIVEITISGPGLAGEVKVTDQGTIAALSEVGGGGVPTNLPPGLGDEFYEIRMSIGGEAGRVFATNVLHYYPDPAGGPGYVLFVEGGFSDAEGWWHRAPSAWDSAFRGVLLSHGVDLAAVSLSPSQSQAETAAAVPADAFRPGVLMGLALAAAVAAGAIGVRRLRATPSRRG